MAENQLNMFKVGKLLMCKHGDWWSLSWAYFDAAFFCECFAYPQNGISERGAMLSLFQTLSMHTASVHLPVSLTGLFCTLFFALLCSHGCLPVALLCLLDHIVHTDTFNQLDNHVVQLAAIPLAALMPEDLWLKKIMRHAFGKKCSRE